MDWEKLLAPLTEADGEAMFALQQEMLSLLPDPRWYFPSTAEEFADQAAHGRALGLRVEGRLIAMNVLVPAWESDHSYAACVGRDEPNTLDFQDVIVAGNYRRQGIHSFLLRHAEDIARQSGMTAIYATVDPDNIPSLASFQKAGYEIIDQRDAYDGRPRYYLRKPLT